ncbi:hypothetical protein, partial [Tenacibaculum finnmarkense]|uniref:hypothetical protein n=1 Tax=Tenacibaculum finnmarkense TaxID=2781243 RepID=UPI001EFB3FE3
MKKTPKKYWIRHFFKMKGFKKNMQNHKQKKEDGIFPALLVYNALFGSDRLLLSIAHFIPQGDTNIYIYS